MYNVHIWCYNILYITHKYTEIKWTQRFVARIILQLSLSNTTKHREWQNGTESGSAKPRGQEWNKFIIHDINTIRHTKYELPRIILKEMCFACICCRLHCCHRECYRFNWHEKKTTLFSNQFFVQSLLNKQRIPFLIMSSSHFSFVRHASNFNRHFREQRSKRLLFLLIHRCVIVSFLCLCRFSSIFFCVRFKASFHFVHCSYAIPIFVLFVTQRRNKRKEHTYIQGKK